MACFFGSYDVSNRLILEDALVFAFPTNIPIVPGHTLVCPKRIVPLYEDLTPEEKEALENARLKVKSALRRLFSAQGFNYALNEGTVGGQSVPHVHIHVVPRKEGDTGVHGYEPREFLYRPGSRAESPEDELIQIALAMREVI